MLTSGAEANNQIKEDQNTILVENEEHTASQTSTQVKTGTGPETTALSVTVGMSPGNLSMQQRKR